MLDEFKKIRKELFLGSVIGLFVFAFCWFLFLNQRGCETPDNLQDVPPRTVDAIIYGKKNPADDPFTYELVTSYNLLPPPAEEVAGGG